jgi:hypothetical protein
VTGVNETLQACVERVLQSETLRNAPSSRRLLRYLADRTLAGETDHLKEYTIGVDAFSKPADYDPRTDSTVRIQVGRLRQKLADYYREEGKQEPAILELPKGQVRLECVARATARETVVEHSPPNPWRVATLILGSLLLISIGWALWTAAHPHAGTGAAAQTWNAELAELWRPFVGTDHPLLIAVGSPLFLQFENKSLYRDLSTENWDDVSKSPSLEAVKKALGSRESRPVHYYAAVGEVSAAFILGQRLGPHQPNMSVVRSSQLQWQQMADANVLFLGPPRFFVDRLQNMPVPLEITETPEGFSNLHPRPGEESLYPYRNPKGFFAEDGDATVLVTHVAGPVGNTDVETFAGNSTFGRVGALKAFTDTSFVHTLVGRMRGPSGHIPRYFQVLLKVHYKGGVPTETLYILHRELRSKT